MTTLPRPTVSRLSWRYYLSGALLLTTALLISLIIPSHHPLEWTVPPFLLAGTWLGFRWRRERVRSRAHSLIAARLERLPQDFTVLHALMIQAPWGRTRIDHLILSRFGVVVVADGIGNRWMLEQVEAVRSLLFAHGHKSPLIPVRSLVLLPPGASDSQTVESDAPVVRVDQVRLHHVAPSSEAILPPEQIRSLTRQLYDLQEFM